MRSPLSFIATPLCLSVAAVATIATCASGSHVAVAGFAAESPWVDAAHSRVRLLDGDTENGETMLAGIQIRLDEGWKTYWRSPGDSGVPPSFDWSGSSNLKSAEVLYPAPGRFADANGTAMGYENEVVFPVKVTPKRPGEPVELKLSIDYGLCKTLCIPNEASLSLELPPEGTRDVSNNLLLDSFLARVPRPAEPGKLPAITGVNGNLDGSRPELVVDAAFPADASDTDLFADAGDTFVPVPKPLGPAKDGKQRFAIDFMSSREAEALKGKPIVFTLVYDGGARQTTWKAE